MTDETFDYSRPPYYSDWRTRTWTCPKCGWQGQGAELQQEFFNDLSELWCPQAPCEYKFGLLIHPGVEETRAAADAGNAEAKVMEQAFARAEQRTQSRVASRGRDLPELEGDSLEFTFTTDGGRDWMNPDWLVLTCRGREIYREPSGFEHWEAIITVSAKVLERYPGRVAWIDPNDAGACLGGDKLYYDTTIKDFLREHQVSPPLGTWSEHPTCHYYSTWSDWRTQAWSCKCGWTGTVHDARVPAAKWPFVILCPRDGSVVAEILAPSKVDRSNNTPGDRYAAADTAARAPTPPTPTW